jgi:protein SCO1/2
MIRSRSKLLFFYALCLCIGGFAIGATYLQLKHPPQPERPLEHIKMLPDFQLTERSGRPVGLSDLKGKVWLADFVYTTCEGPCPLISGHLAKLQKEALQNPNVRFVSITTDPGHDTPETLRSYAERFGASPDRWLFLTGEKTKVHELIRDGFMLAVVEQPNEPQPIIHSTKLMLVDKNGVIRNFYDGTSDAENAAILADIQRLLKE